MISPRCQGLSPCSCEKLGPPSAVLDWGTDIATVDQVEGFMFKMSMCGVGLLLAGLVACSNQSGLNVTGGSTSGGQGISGTGGISGGGLATGQSDCEKAGGTCDPITPGGCLGGWTPNTDGYSCASSTTFCCFPLSYSPCETAGGTCLAPGPATCPDGTIDDTSQYQCSNGGGPSMCCMPSANGGASRTGGTSGDAGSSGTTGNSGGSVGVGGVGSGGTSGGTGGTVSCFPAECFIPACTGELQPTPCGCPICVPKPDAGVAKDAGLADTQLPACPMLANLNSTDAAQVGYSAARGLVKCGGTAGASGVCVGNDPGSGCGSALGDSVGCSNLCAANQYGLAYGGVGPLAPPPSIDLPAGCGSALYTPAGVAFYCCPCGT